MSKYQVTTETLEGQVIYVLHCGGEDIRFAFDPRTKGDQYCRLQCEGAQMFRREGKAFTFDENGNLVPHGDDE